MVNTIEEMGVARLGGMCFGAVGFGMVWKGGVRSHHQSDGCGTAGCDVIWRGLARFGKVMCGMIR